MKSLVLIICMCMTARLMAQVLSSEYVFDQGPFTACHASTIVELKNGAFMVAWFAGTAEGNQDVAIWFSKKTSTQWTTPMVLVRESNTPCWNPVLFYTNDQRLWFYYKYGTHPTTWSAARKYSDDHGVTWSKTEYLPAGLYGPIRAKPLVLANGIVVSGTSVESYHNWAVWIERSTDHGKTFQKIGPITVPDNTAQLETDKGATHDFDWNKTHGIIQPSIVTLTKKHLRLYARSTARTGRIVVADSYDQGKTWTQGRSIQVLNPNSGIDASTLADGRILLVYNNTSDGRSPLNVAVSTDGEHFKMIYTLEDTPDGEFSYPNVIQSVDGLIHITYTWLRQRIKHVILKP